MISVLPLLYLDPGTGSYLVQAIVAGALGVVFFFKNIVSYIRGFFAMLTRKKKSIDQESEDGSSKNVKKEPSE